MMSHAARELRRQRWADGPVARMRPKAQSGARLSRIALRFIQAMGWWSGEVRP